jgi:AraC-like DNA-binding protein
MEITVANITPRAILRLCATRGVPTDNLLSSAGIGKKQIADPDARISAEQVFKLWEEAEKLTNDEFIAARTAHSLPIGTYKIVDYLLVTSATPHEGLKMLARYFRLVNGAFDLRLTSKNGQSRFELHNPFDSEGPSHLYVEFVFAVVQSRLWFATEVNWRPKEIYFTHPPPRNAANYNKVFQCPVRFSQPINQMVLDHQLLGISQPQSDPSLNEILVHHAQRLLKRLPTEEDFLNDLRRTLGHAFNSGDVRLETAAKKLAMSRRALQRKLNQQGTSFSEVLDQMRYELAIELLAEPHIKTEEISYCLRFSEPSSFYRAFRRWTGMTPQQYQKRES